MKKSLAFGLVILLAFNTLNAHDMWLIPKQPTVSLGDKAEIGISIGMDFPNGLNGIGANRITLIATNGIDTIRELSLTPDAENKVNEFSFSPESPGLWIVGCTTQKNRIELEAKKFNDYLLHDGLPHVLAERLDRDELGKNATEQYSKYTKTLIAVTGDAAISELDVWSKPLGHKLEIVFLENPLAKNVGDTLKAKVLFEGKPLEAANLCWDEPGNGEKFAGQTWTDSQGEATLPIAKAGLMTVRLVHMTRPATSEFEWESYWSSFTFSIH